MVNEKSIYYDFYATLQGFREACTVAGNLKRREVLPLVREVKKCPCNYSRRYGARQYAYEDMYQIFISSPIARAICEKRKLFRWEDVVYRFIDKTEENRVRYEVRFPCPDYDDYYYDYE